MIHTFFRRGVLFALLASLVAVVLTIPAIPATADGSVRSLTSCGQPITAQGGTYRLDADVAATPPTDCFDISANNVTLILDGHTITTSGITSNNVGIRALGSGATILGPGTLSGWTEGIQLRGGSGSVRGVTVTGNLNGIGVMSAGNDVRGSGATDNRGSGILVFFVSGLVGATGNTIIGNFAHNNGPQGVDLEDNNLNCDSNVWLGNDFGTSFPAQPSCIH